MRRFEPEARAALEWIDQYGDLDGDGYVEYQRRNTKTGLDNQCWKDSRTLDRRPHGALASAPRASARCRATCTTPRSAARGSRAKSGRTRSSRAAGARGRRAQGALQPRLLGRGARLLRARARRREAADGLGRLQHRSPALERDRRRGQGAVGVRHLLGPGLYSGWGVRTMSADEVTYNPIGYHLGTVWPHDNSLIVAGLARYGYREEAAQIAADCSKRRRTSTAACRRRSPATRARRRASRSSTRPRAARKRGRPARRCCSSGRCSASSPRGTRSNPIRIYRL